MMRRAAWAGPAPRAAVSVAAALFAATVWGGTVSATPVASIEQTYSVAGRAFPDPHGCVRGAPRKSPWAKGAVCAAQFVQWDEAIAGLEFLEQRFPRYLQVINLRTMFGDHPAFQGEDLQSAGLPTEDLSRARRDLYVVKVTDVRSPVPEARRKHFAYSLSIHGIERAGLEGGIRAIEDLVTWAACEDDEGAAPACAREGPFPKRILEPTDAGPTATEVLRNGVVYFVLANPDGWARGEVTEGGVSFQRYNGNGMDLNRDWPTIGYTERQYTPASEPETRGYSRFLRWVRDTKTPDGFAGAIDLHGMLTARSFSFTLLGAGQRDFAKNQETVQTSILTFRDSERRLAWSPLIAPADDCPGEVEEPAFGGNAPMCSDQWGTVWDTIDYQVTGSFGDWMDSPLGLNAVGIDNEMALSHITPNTVFDPDLEQLHIDGNKGLVYAQIAALLNEEEVRFRPGGRVAYVLDPKRITSDGAARARSEPLPVQDTIEEISANGIREFRFDVLGTPDGVDNGGLTIEATFGNVRGISPAAAAELSLEYCGPPDHPGDEEGCREVAEYFNQSPLYLQAGARIDLTDPRPGPYRIVSNPGRALPTKFVVDFSHGPAYPEPKQAPYDVSRMDFFDDLNRYAEPGGELQPLHVDHILANPAVLRAFDSVVVADDFMPGFVPDAARQLPGEPQDGIEFSLGPQSAPAPGAGVVPVPSGTFEFDVRDGFDNDRMIVDTSWATPGDYDVHVERQDPGTDEWAARGCECEFVNNGETVTVFAPEPGRWRVRAQNFASAPQTVQGSVTFAADPAPPAAPESRFTTADLERYAGALAEFAARGGNVTLTDEAMTGLPALGTGIDSADVDGGVFYAGWMDFDDGKGPTYERHGLASDVNKEGTAEGQGEVGDEEFDNRHQTYEPVPLGYYVSPSGSGNSSCDSDRCDSPNWIVSQKAWEDAGGSTAARTLVRTTPSPGSPTTTGTSLGELPIGRGTVRVLGALLPDPTEQNHHPYGLSSYALTYTGYQIFENAIDWENPGRVDAVHGARIACTTCQVSARAGETATASIAVRNLGSDADTFVFDALGLPARWTVAFEPASATLEPWERALAAVRITPPRSARPGTYVIEARAASTEDASAQDRVELLVTVARGR